MGGNGAGISMTSPKIHNRFAAGHHRSAAAMLEALLQASSECVATLAKPGSQSPSTVVAHVLMTSTHEAFA